MSAVAKLAGFALALAVAFGAAYGIGATVGPLGPADTGSSISEQEQMPGMDMQSETSR